MAAPSILLLNGTSSSGKSTLARALQRRLQPQPVLTGLDSFVFGLLPPSWHNTPHGVYFTRDDQGAVAVNLGEGGRAMAKAFHRSVVALADSGLTVIVDDVLFEPWLLADWLEATLGREVFFLGVRCDLAEAERREVARGDRQPGQARSHFAQVHAHNDYDFVVDTTRTDPRACAAQVLDALQSHRPSTAFQQLRRQASEG